MNTGVNIQLRAFKKISAQLLLTSTWLSKGYKWSAHPPPMATVEGVLPHEDMEEVVLMATKHDNGSGKTEGKREGRKEGRGKAK